MKRQGIALAILSVTLFLLAVFMGYRPTEADSYFFALLLVLVVSAAGVYAALKSRK